MKIIWLASYPRSGNTWLRTFLYNYLWGKPDSTLEIQQRIPDLHKTGDINPNSQKDLLCKTHRMLDTTHPFYAQTGGFIYTVRHPKDVLLSCYNYCLLEGDKIDSLEAFAYDFITHGGVKKWHIMQADSWLQHVIHWLNTPTFPHLLLRYEDMLSEPEKAFTQVLQFLNITMRTDRFFEALENSSFEQMKSMEAQEKNQMHSIFRGTKAATQSTHSFVNRGRSSQSLKEISNEIDHSFNKKFGAIMQKLGYN